MNFDNFIPVKDVINVYSPSDMNMVFCTVHPSSQKAWNRGKVKTNAEENAGLDFKDNISSFIKRNTPKNKRSYRI